MSDKTSEQYEELTDYFAQTIHKFVDRLRDQAGGMEMLADRGSQVELKELAMEKIDREVNRMQEFVAKNPARAAVMAFGVGAVASRVLGGPGPSAKPEPVEVEAPAAKPKKASAKKAPAKKAAPKKTPAKKAAVKKAPVKKAA